MQQLKLTVLSLRYSSWSIRPWLALTQAGAVFATDIAKLESFDTTTLAERRKLGSVAGLFPILRVDGTAIHESLAICETVAELFPRAMLWPEPAIDRALARALCCEMVSNFSAIRSEMPCHLFGRAPAFRPSAQAQKNIDRVFEIWTECLERSGGPLLFGQVSLADFFYFPVLTRFRTYGVALEGEIQAYAETVEALPAVEALFKAARQAPRMALYDDYIVKHGGDPNATD